jgi:hypothetical protein
MSTPEELLVQILANDKKIAFGTTLGTDVNDNCTVQTTSGSILARSPDRISAGNCIALKTDDGEWYALSASLSGSVQKSTIFKKVNRTEKGDRGTTEVIFLFQKTNGNILDFYVGGDRDSPEVFYRIEKFKVGKVLSLVYGSIQKTGIYKNSFVVNLLIKEDPYVARFDDITEPSTYYLYTIRSIDEGSKEEDAEIDALDDSRLEDGIYLSPTLSAFKQSLVLPRYPSRDGSQLLQNFRATLSDRGFYFGFGEPDPQEVKGFADFIFQYGYFGSFEIGLGTISENRSGAWHELNIPFDEIPVGSVIPSANLDSIPQFSPGQLKYQQEPFQTEYDYTHVKNQYVDPPVGAGVFYRVYLQVQSRSDSQYGGATLYVTSASPGGNRLLNPPTNLFIRTSGFRLAGPVSVVGYRDTLNVGNQNGTSTTRGQGIEFSTGNGNVIVFAGIYNFDDPPFSGTGDTVEGTASVYKILREDGPEGDDGCSDVDANNYVERQPPQYPDEYDFEDDRRTPKTCTYNPFVVRANQRTVECSFELDTDIEVDVLPEPEITPTQQIFSFNNPIRTLTTTFPDEEILDTREYSIPIAGGGLTSQQIVVTHIPRDPFTIGRVEPQRLLFEGEYFDTKFLTVSHDKQTVLVKKLPKYPTEIQNEIEATTIGNTPTISSEQIALRDTVVTGLGQDIPYSQFKIPSNFFDAPSINNGNYIFDLYSANFAFDDTIFVVAAIAIPEDGKTIEIIKTKTRTPQGAISISHEPLYSDFVGDTIGDIVDASAFFEAD